MSGEGARGARSGRFAESLSPCPILGGGGCPSLSGLSGGGSPSLWRSLSKSRLRGSAIVRVSCEAPPRLAAGSRALPMRACAETRTWLQGISVCPVVHYLEQQAADMSAAERCWHYVISAIASAGPKCVCRGLCARASPHNCTRNLPFVWGNARVCQACIGNRHRQPGLAGARGLSGCGAPKSSAPGWVAGRRGRCKISGAPNFPNLFRCVRI